MCANNCTNASLKLIERVVIAGIWCLRRKIAIAAIPRDPGLLPPCREPGKTPDPYKGLPSRWKHVSGEAT